MDPACALAVVKLSMVDIATMGVTALVAGAKIAIEQALAWHTKQITSAKTQEDELHRGWEFGARLMGSA
ncbi:MAG: hypothetical protein U0263_41695 [Polyangiaceae bacterium]